MDIGAAITLAFEHHRAGRLDDAAKLYSEVLAVSPDDVNALHGMGFLCNQRGDPRRAEELMRRAVALQPRFAAFHSSLAEVLHRQGRNDESAAELREALALQPDDKAAWLNLGIVLHALRRMPESIEACRRAVQLDPKNPDTHSQLACGLLAMSRATEAAQASRTALDLDPNHTGAANNLGEALRHLDRPSEAALCYERAIKTAKTHAAAMYNNLGITRLMQGRVEEAIAEHRRALESRPDYPDGESNLLYTMHYSAKYDAAAIRAEHERWAQTLEARIGAPRQHHPNPRDPNRRLRIGYVSSDFRKHAIEHFIEPILANHDHENFEVTAYTNGLRTDASTQRLRGYCDHWREIQNLSDIAADQMIAKDGIDILIDLSVHSAGDRLPVFARKPAPVQITYLGYPGTTGLRQVDYRITAQGLDLPGENEGPEKLLSLPHSYFCYQPPRQSPPVADSPCLKSGYVTFGSCNRLAKIDLGVIELWSKLLIAVPDAKLQLLAIALGEPITRRLILGRFAAHNIAADRLILLPSTDEAGYLAAHHKIDIALDPFPFNGGTTSLHAIWMGVPMITLAGKLPVGRMGSNILTNLELQELIAQTPDEYVAIAQKLASEKDRLKELRRNMRPRLQASPIMQPEQFTRDLEKLYRQAWVTWCETK